MLKIRLRRMGAKHRPFYRVVVSESNRVPQSAFVENVGHYDPLRQPPVIQLDLERIDHWMGLGARPSDRVRKLMNAFVVRKERGLPEPTASAATPTKSEPAKKEETAEAAPAAEETVAEAAPAETPAEETPGENAGESNEKE